MASCSSAVAVTRMRREGCCTRQIMEVPTAADATLQQDGGQVSDDINGEVEVDLHAIGVGELKILHRLVEVPVLLVQTDLGKNLAEGISSFF